MSQSIDHASARMAQARIGKRIGKQGYLGLIISSCLLAASGIGFGIAAEHRWFYLGLGLSICCYVPAVWWKRQLEPLPPDGLTIADRLSGAILTRLSSGSLSDPKKLISNLSDHWQAKFISSHLMLRAEDTVALIENSQGQAEKSLKLASNLADFHHSPLIELGYLYGALLYNSPAIRQTITARKGRPDDIEAVTNWLARNLSEIQNAPRYYGGIGRDWAFGYTPLLNRFGYNLSLGIINHGAHFGALTESAGVLAIESALQNNSDAIALVGPDGIGKTNSVYAFAQRLIEGKTAANLAYHQIVVLNATDITSAARKQGELERIMLSLANEASHAGHIILFFDNAQLFFADQAGAFDASKIFLSLTENNTVPIILALTPNDWQHIKSNNQSLTNLFTPIMLQEPPESGVMNVLEDSALGLEGKHRVLIAYEAFREAYRLSGRYEQDEAYPGKAVKLLTQAVSHSQNSLVDAGSVQRAVEQTRGVKATSAAPAEASALLSLESDIHKRMVNQSHAVSSVASALRRARAGVTNPKRPIGSFLFLGPTGVGKTELARSVAATYFGSETAMVRIDMSEYQQPDDVQRLLSGGEQEQSSLLMSVRNQPFSVVLLDEIEKAHTNILNLLLQLLDEGQLTDMSGRSASFRDCIVICTSNAGAQQIRERIERGESLESFAPAFNDELISSGQFKPELLNRFDETVLFRPLTTSELAQVVELMIVDVNRTLSNQNISVALTAAAVQKIVDEGHDPRLGARPLRRALQKAVENSVAQKILRGEAQPGDVINLDVKDLAA